MKVNLIIIDHIKKITNKYLVQDIFIKHLIYYK